MQNLLLEPFKQVRFGLYILGITLFFLGISSLILVNSFLEQYRHVLAIFKVVDPHLRWEFIADDVFYSSIGQMGICFAVFILILFFVIFKLTHRYYGPIVAIKRFTHELKRGNYTARIQLRKNDELKDLALELNQLAQILESKKQ